MGQRQLLRGILIGLGLLAAMLVWVVVWLLTRSPVALLLAHPELPPIVGLAPVLPRLCCCWPFPSTRCKRFGKLQPLPPNDAPPVSNGKSFSPPKAGLAGICTGRGSSGF